MECIHVFIGLHGGIVDEVKAFSTEKDAIDAWEEYTYKRYDDYCVNPYLLENQSSDGSTVHKVIIT